ncbi:MAG TPA: alpha/beta hydrolase [Puia sp.]|nr:alpha/beta hydrolase [Puia sp.]
MQIKIIFLLLILSACNNGEKTPDAASAANPRDSATTVNPGTSAATGNAADAAIKPALPPADFKDQYATVNGVRIHYVTGGTGEPLLLVHGFGQNWYMWNRLLPEFSKHFTVIAADLRGVGESEKPTGGYDKKTMATDLHELMKQLGYKNINIAGHDIGLMVAYAYAAQFGDEVKKIALMDALLPGIEPVWSNVKAQAWWFGFFGWPSSGALVAGRERLFLTGFWPVVGHVNDAFTKEETDEFIRAYSQPGATTAAFHWFGNFEQDARDNKELARKKLKMPLLAMGGEYQAAAFLADHCRLVAENVKESKIKGSGHWMVQENTAQVQKDLLDFFMGK